VFDNEVFDEWLDQKAQEILGKVGRDTIETEEMIILILKAQTNHFSHMDDEFRGQFTQVGVRISGLEGRMDSLKKRMDGLEVRMDRLDARIEKLCDRIVVVGVAFAGAMVTGFGGIYLKLFLT